MRSVKFKCVNPNCGHIFTAKKRGTLDMYRCPICNSASMPISRVKIKKLEKSTILGRESEDTNW